jgi:hypothetical protein
MSRYALLMINIFGLNLILIVGIVWYLVGMGSMYPIQSSQVEQFNFHLYLPESQNFNIGGANCQLINRFTYNIDGNNSLPYYHYDCQSIIWKRVTVTNLSPDPVLISRFNYSGLGTGQHLANQVYVFQQQTYYITINLDSYSGSEELTIMQLDAISVGPITLGATTLILSGGVERNYLSLQVFSSLAFDITVASLIGLSLLTLGLTAWFSPRTHYYDRF